jgi:hypothetical protein
MGPRQKIKNRNLDHPPRHTHPHPLSIPRRRRHAPTVCNTSIRRAILPPPTSRKRRPTGRRPLLLLLLLLHIRVRLSQPPALLVGALVLARLKPTAATGFLVGSGSRSSTSGPRTRLVTPAARVDGRDGRRRAGAGPRRAAVGARPRSSCPSSSVCVAHARHHGRRLVRWGRILLGMLLLLRVVVRQCRGWDAAGRHDEGGLGDIPLVDGALHGPRHAAVGGPKRR